MAFFPIQLSRMTRVRRHCFCGLVLLASALALNGCAGTPQQDYAKSIKDAAARGPGWDVPLTPLPPGRLTVSTFTDDMALDTETIYTWVAPAGELRQRCKAKPDAKHDTVLALEQILGLPPLKNPKPGHEWRVYVFDVEARDLFRPCPGGLDTSAPADKPRCRLSSDIDPTLDPEFTTFLLQQWWSAHRTTVEPGNDPELGYPWTGMGWTYDWDPASKTHIGVSEFVVKKHAMVGNLRVRTPAEFCASTG